MEDRVEGYWKGRVTPDLPMPIPDIAWAGRDAFLTRLDAVERIAPERHTKGFSLCRLCGEANGSSEYRMGGWRWPEGLRHYLADHGVRPSADFEAFVDRTAIEASPSQDGG